MAERFKGFANTFEKYALHEAARVGDITASKDIVDAIGMGRGTHYHRDSHKTLAEHLALRDHLELTPLHHAVFKGQTEVVEFLVEQGADVNATSSTINGDTPLIWAVREGHDHIAACLVENGADVDATGSGSMTALLYAVKRYRPELLQYLLEHNADPDVTDVQTGRTIETLLEEALSARQAAQAATSARPGALLRRHSRETIDRINKCLDVFRKFTRPMTKSASKRCQPRPTGASAGAGAGDTCSR